MRSGESVSSQGLDFRAALSTRHAGACAEGRRSAGRGADLGQSVWPSGVCITNARLDMSDALPHRGGNRWEQRRQSEKAADIENSLEIVLCAGFLWATLAKGALRFPFTTSWHQFPVSEIRKWQPCSY